MGYLPHKSSASALCNKRRTSAGPARSIAKVRRDVESCALAEGHLEQRNQRPGLASGGCYLNDALVPALDNLALQQRFSFSNGSAEEWYHANSELEEVAAVARTVKLLAAFCQCAGVCDTQSVIRKETQSVKEQQK